MKKLLLLIMTFNFISCGFKGPPTPIFPASKTQIDKEIELRKDIPNDSK